MMNKDFKVAVVGIGLIGGSILKRLSHKGFYLIGNSRSSQTIEKVKDLGIADAVSTDINIIKTADLVFVCTPINKMLETIDTVVKIVGHKCIITDVASLKGFIIDHVNGQDLPINFIGGHPMAGTEHSGVDSSFETLFDGAKWVLTPSKFADQNSINKLKEIIKLLGAEAIEADPHSHDRAVALISHLPLLISQALFGLVNDYEDEKIKNLALKLASSGFRDTTRLAATNPELAIDILLDNKINVQDSALKFIDYLQQLNQNLENKDQMTEKINELANRRGFMYSREGKNTL